MAMQLLLYAALHPLVMTLELGTNAIFWQAIGY